MLPALQHFNYASRLLIPALCCLGSQLIKILIILLLISSPSFVSFHHMAVFRGQINVIELIKPITLIIQRVPIGQQNFSPSASLTFLHEAPSGEVSAPVMDPVSDQESLLRLTQGGSDKLAACCSAIS